LPSGQNNLFQLRQRAKLPEWTVFHMAGIPSPLEAHESTMPDHVPAMLDRVPPMLDGVSLMLDSDPITLDGVSAVLDDVPAVLDGVPERLEDVSTMPDRVALMLDEAPVTPDRAPTMPNTYEQLSQEDKARLLVYELQRSLSSEQRFGPDCFESLLKVVGLAGKVDGDAKTQNAVCLLIKINKPIEWISIPIAHGCLFVSFAQVSLSVMVRLKINFFPLSLSKAK
jgi:hypothetical protein